MPCFPAEPPKTDSSPGGGGGFRDGLGEPGVAYVLKKKGRATALYRGKRRKLIALNAICADWSEEGKKKGEIGMERKMRSDSQLPSSFVEELRGVFRNLATPLYY